MTEDHSRNNSNVCFHICMLRSRTKESAPRFPSQQSTVSHTLPDHTMNWNRTLLWLLIALSIHSTSTFQLFSPLPSISLWGSEGREQGFFFFFPILQMRKLKVNFRTMVLNLGSILKWPKSYKNPWPAHIPDQHQNLGIWNPKHRYVFKHSKVTAKCIQPTLRTTGWNDLYSIFRHNCLLPKCSSQHQWQRYSISLNIVAV